MTETDPLAPRIIVPDTTFRPPAPRAPNRVAPGNPLSWYVAVFMLVLLAAFIGLGALIVVILGGSPRPIGVAVATALAMCHFVFRPRHRWWAVLAAVIGYVVGSVSFLGFLPRAYALDCATGVAITAYVLVTHLPERRRISRVTAGPDEQA